ncbi:MAG: hypothetical protein J6Y02_21725 [Pseudobutyrivibrio sp.]|nr:hypothetical protein [Pseudobutyrivibrio sp.]
MFKMTQTYTDYDGNEKTETFYFNLNKVEILEMEAEEDGGYSDMLKRVVASKDSKELMKLFKQLLLKSYGVKTEDGGFAKSEELVKKFEQSAAYPEIFMALCTDAQKASDFVSYVMPLSEQQRNELKDAKISELPEKT